MVGVSGGGLFGVEAGNDVGISVSWVCVVRGIGSGEGELDGTGMVVTGNVADSDRPGGSRFMGCTGVWRLN